MNNENGIDLKPVIDEATSVEIPTPIMINELGYFHTAESTMVSGVSNGPPVTALPKANIGDFLRRMTVITNGSMLTTNTTFQILQNIDPWNLYLTNAFIADKISNYKLLRSGLEVQISVNAPAGAYGLYYLVAVPQGVANPLGVASIINFRAENLLALPHIQIDIANSTDGRLTLPWIHWNDYGEILGTTTESVAGQWRLILYCAQPIATGTGDETPSATYRIWARCTEDYDMVIPYAQMQKDFNHARSDINKTAIAATGMKPSGIAGAISTGAGVVASTVPFLAPLAGPVSAIAGGISTVLGWFGFTRDTDQQTPTVFVPRPYSNVANMDCADTSEIAALSKDNSISYDPRISMYNAEDESAFSYLFSKWILIGITPWQQSDVAGTELVNIPVTPFISRVGMETGSVFTSAGFVGFPFRYWRGGMQYKIIIPMSKFHRGVLQISWSPSIMPVAVDITNVRFNQVLDIGNCAEWEFTIGYASQYPVLENIAHLYDAAIVSTAGANGLFTITVTNPLTAQTETANTNIFVFARACPNMDFSVPRNLFGVLDDDGATPEYRDFTTGFRLQAGALGDEKVKVQSFTLVPDTTFPIKEVCSGEHVDSVRALVQKFSRDLNLSKYSQGPASVFGIQADRVFFPHFPLPPIDNQLHFYYPTDLTQLCHSFTWAGYFLSMFVGAAGSVRYKLINNTSRPSPFGFSHATTIPGVNVTALLEDADFSSVNPMWVPNTGEGVEITVPYYHSRKYMLTHSVSSAGSTLSGQNDTRMDILEMPVRSFSVNDDSSGATPTVYKAMGPDIRFHVFRCVPTIALSTAPIFPDWNQFNSSPA